MSMEAEVFISYARENQRFVRRIAEALAASGNHTWVDWEGIEPSDRWLQSVHEAIDAADAVVAILSTAFLSSEPCRGEIAHAAQQHKRLIPVVIEDLPEEAPIPDSLRELNWIFLRPEDGFENGMERLIRAIGLDLDLVRIHTRVLTRAQAWDLSGRRTTSLLRGVDLDQAEQWLARAAAGTEPQPTELQANFVRAARQNTTRRHRIILAIATTVAAVSAALAAFALVQRSTAIHQAHVATSRELAADAESHLSGDPQLALILALRAYRNSGTPEAATAVRHAVQSSVVRAYLDRPGGDGQPEFDRTGDYVVTVGSAGLRNRSLSEVRVWAWRRPAGTSKRLWVLHDRGASCARFAGDQTIVNIVNADGTVLRWRWRTSSRASVVGKLPLHSEFCQLSPDNRTVAEDTDSGVAIGSLTKPAAKEALLPGTEDGSYSSFSPDGHFLVTYASNPVRVYNVANRRVIDQFDITKNGPYERSNGAAIDATDSQLAVAEIGATPSVAIYDLHSPTSPPVIRQLTYTPPGLPVPSGNVGMTLASMSWSPNGNVLAVGWLGDTRIWWGSNPTPIYLNASDGQAEGGVAFTADGRYLVTSGTVLQVWDWQASRPAVLALPSTTGLRSALLSPDGQLVAVCNNGKTLLWDWREASSTTLTTGCPKAFSSDGRYLAVVATNSQFTASTLSVWSIRTRQELRSFSVTSPILQAEFLPKSDSVVFLDSNSQLADWDWVHSSGSNPSAPALRLPSGYSSLVRGPPKDRWVYYLVGRHLYRWGGQVGQHPVLTSRHALSIPENVRRYFEGYADAALLPDHRHIVVSLVLALTDDGGVTVLSDSRTGATHEILSARSSVPSEVSRDGRLIAVTGITGDVLVWDLGGSDAPVQVATADTATLSFDASGSLLALTTQNGFEVVPCSDCGSLAHVLSVAKNHVVRPLTPTEQRTYLHSG